MNGETRASTTVAQVSVKTGARLHCGLFSDERPEGRRFQGFGLMIDRPGFHVIGRQADNCADGALHSVRLSGNATEVADSIEREIISKAESYLQTLDAAWEASRPLDIQIQRIIPPHTGLGSGTQLAYALATVWNELHGSELTAQDLRQRLQRGKRSCIGSFGFYRGGVLIDAGMRSGESQGACRYAALLPTDWRVVLVAPRGVQGIAGTAELNAFQKLPPLPTQQVERLSDLLDTLQNVVEDFGAFSAVLREFGLIVGESFSAIQGGRFSHPACEQAFAALSRLGIEGVAQSSWGPTMFGLCADPEQAVEITEQLQRSLDEDKFDVQVAVPLNRGATITFAPADTSDS